MKKVMLFLLSLVSINFTNAQWQLNSTGTPSGGVTYCFIESSGTILSATDGVYASVNNGNLWSSSNTGITSIVVSLGKNSAGIFAGSDSSIYFSNNNGSSWSVVNNGGYSVFAFAFLTDTVFAATMGGGIIRSINNGLTWSTVNSGITTNFVYSIVAKGHLLFAGTIGDGIFMSSNSGLSWSAVNTGLPSPVAIRCLETDGTNLYAGTTQWFGPTIAACGMYISHNNGVLWTQVTNGISTTNAINHITTIGNALLAGSGDGNVYRSLDSGATWINFTNGINPGCQFGTAGFLETSQYVFCGIENPCSGTIYRINKNEVLSVNELNEQTLISIYPNPLTTSSILQLNAQVKDAEVVIYDMLGKEMVRKKMNGDKMEIEKGNLESGIYFVRVRSEERQWVGKMVVE